ncbi:MAG TPA: T9SS type A sorting domain-containing protein [Candidatus Acidoferrales bacterium]|nr:T9SS type A sorting domain-containing protein [Candidatus Acidoferrales bacterium]
MCKKIFLAVVALMAVSVCSANAQGWQFVKIFPDSGFNPGVISGGGINNALTVDPMGRVWMASYRYDDSLARTGGGMIPVKSIYVFNSDGSQASFSPLHVLMSRDGTVKDTLNGGIMGFSYSYGMTTGPSDGDIYMALPSAYIIKLDYHDGTEIQKIENPIPGYASSLASCAVDNAGEVFTVGVIGAPTGPIALTSDFTQVAESIDTSEYNGVARAIAVSGDGNDVYVPYFANFQIISGQDTAITPVVLHYHSSAGTLSQYVLQDTLLKGLSVESMAWQPGSGYLWCGSGGPVTDKNTDTAFSPLSWYAFDMTNPSNPVLKDSIKWNLTAVGIGADSLKTTIIDDRGIAFSPSGDTAYVAVFNSNINCVQMFTGHVTAVNQTSLGPTSYILSQNYPNPFNPTTKIEYSLKNNVKVTLKVYDVLGREVATLVDAKQSAGQHFVTFNGDRFASGIYLYSLVTSDGFKMTKKMVLLK